MRKTVCCVLLVVGCSLARGQIDSLRNAEFTRLVNQGDSCFKREDQMGAKMFYNTALLLREDCSVRQRINWVDGSGGPCKDSLEMHYLDLVALGEYGFLKSRYLEAIAAYKKASELKPNEQFPKDEINNCRQFYKGAQLVHADSLFFSGRFHEAKFFYEVAMTYLNDNGYVPHQRQECDNRMKEAENKSEYIEAKGDSCWQVNDKTGAGKYWKEAQQLTFSRKCALATKLDRINGGPTDCSLSNDWEYQLFIMYGDASFSKKDFFAARIAYENAIRLSAGERYPQEMLRICDAKLNR
jgi:tetratricopeptide (TPR) repeat protein